MSSAKFCTCKDHGCKLNPVNHDKGCTPCIAKCLNDNEIPSCFFIKAKGDIKGISDFSIQGFAHVINEIESNT